MKRGRQCSSYRWIAGRKFRYHQHDQGRADRRIEAWFLLDEKRELWYTVFSSIARDRELSLGVYRSQKRSYYVKETR